VLLDRRFLGLEIEALDLTKVVCCIVAVPFEALRDAFWETWLRRLDLFLLFGGPLEVRLEQHGRFTTFWTSPMNSGRLRSFSFFSRELRCSSGVRISVMFVGSIVKA